VNEVAETEHPPRPGILLGTQGWSYADWAGSVYPDGAASSSFLDYYARTFETVEVDSTFYGTPPARTVQGWVEKTPQDFTFALKLPSQITHENRLRDSSELLADFADVARQFGSKLGPVLIQLAPDFDDHNLPSLVSFLPLLPRDVRFAIEFRDRAWIRDEVLDLIAEHRVALALSDGPWLERDRILELVRQPTTDFHYVRWMGDDRSLTRFTHVQIDRSVELQEWADALKSAPVDTVFGYFNNQFAGHSPTSIRDMQRLLGIETKDPTSSWEQTTLF
jgi:uncharacterized protein YecE (DUF72 family)